MSGNGPLRSLILSWLAAMAGIKTGAMKAPHLERESVM